MSEHHAMPASWWQRWHWPEYAAECAGTAWLVFVGLSAVVLDFGIGSPVAHLIPAASGRLLLTGLLFAGSGSLVAISPLGKLSGAHINPALSFAFWLHGKLHATDLFGYWVGQFSGALIGAALLRWAWGLRAVSVRDGMTLPNPAYPLWWAFAAEMLLTALLIFTIFCFVSQRQLMRWTPLVTWLLVATMVWREAPLSGTSLNPARSFGPAFIATNWHDYTLYLFAPLLGAVIAVGLYRLLAQNYWDVLTGKLFHVTHYRSLFTRVTASALPAGGRLRTSRSHADSR